MRDLKKWSPQYLLDQCLEATVRGESSVAPALRAAAAGDRSRALYRYVEGTEPPNLASEQEFYDALDASLRQGEVLLLIAGDGIRSDVEDMARYIQQPGLLFTLGLVELKVYELDGFAELLVVPRVIARTREEVIRAVVTIQDAQSRSVSAEVRPTPAAETQRARGSRGPTLTDERFRERLLRESGIDARTLGDWLAHLQEFITALGLEPDYGESSLIAHLPDPRESDDD